MADHYAMQEICWYAHHKKTIEATKIIEDQKNPQYMKDANATIKPMKHEDAREEHLAIEYMAINIDFNKFNPFKNFLNIIGKLK